MKTQLNNLNTQIWCHFCQASFYTNLKPGKDNIICPQCNNDFCQVKTRFDNPQKFKPYQKNPEKKQKYRKKVNKAAINMTINQLAQILQIRQSQNFQITQDMLKKLRNNIDKRSQCSVCGIELQINQQAVVPQCRHIFHEQCLIEWMKRKNTCPSCRQEIIKNLQKNEF